MIGNLHSVPFSQRHSRAGGETLVRYKGAEKEWANPEQWSAGVGERPEFEVPIAKWFCHDLGTFPTVSVRHRFWALTWCVFLHIS